MSLNKQVHAKACNEDKSLVHDQPLWLSLVKSKILVHNQPLWLPLVSKYYFTTLSAFVVTTC